MNIVYYLDEYWRQFNDKRFPENTPFVQGGPLPTLTILIAYVYFVKIAGPRLMEGRKPFKLNGIIRAYNLALTIGHLIGFVRTAYLSRMGLDFVGCVEFGNDTVNEMLFWGYIFSMSKMIELMDTVFFILRKKYTQASNLHLFHHSFIMPCSWLYIKAFPLGSGAIFPFVNSGVHTVMYGYYFLSTFEGLKPYLWWKRHLTKAQIIQFGICMCQFGYLCVAKNCQHPGLSSLIGFIFNLVFLVLFTDFYRRSYAVGNTNSTRYEVPRASIDKTSLKKIV